MRRHAKASSAGSTMRRAKGFGHLRALAVALAALFLLALAPTLAAAAVDPEYLGAFGPDGTEATSFERVGPVAVDEGAGVVYVGDSKKQVLYKFDSEGNPLNWSGSAGYISGNEITGLSFNEGGAINQAAVDPETHVLYVTSGNKVRAFEASGEPHLFSEGLGAGTSEIPGAIDLRGVAVDANGAIYAADSQFVPRPAPDIHEIRIYSRTGALLTEFEPEIEGEAPRSRITPTSLAVAPDGSLYAVNFLFPAYRLEPSQFPVTASTTYAPGERLKGGTSLSLAVDPMTSHVYVGVGVGSDRRVTVFDEDDNPVGRLGAAGEAGELVGLAAGVAVNGDSERVYVADYRESTNSGQVKVFETFTFPVIAPTVTATSVIDLNLFTATLRGKVNPNTLETTYHFEYGTEDCKVSACTSTPGGTIPAGHKPVALTPQEITGLQPGTTYHYRVVAKNSKGETKGPDRTFTTPRSGLGFNLADQRAWEMVSPSNKFGGRIIQAGQGVMQAAANGNGIAYESVTSIESNPDGNRAIDFSTVLARRGAAGSWSSKDITPPQTEASPIRFGGVYKTLSTNLERALLEQQDNTPLSIEASEETPYLRENTEPGTYRPLVTGKEGFENVPPGTKFGGGAGSAASPVAIRAADPALTHPVFKSRTPLVPGAAEGSLYQWDEGQLQPVSELPASEGGAVVRADAGAGIGSVHNTVSADGSRVFWSTGEPAQRNLTGLYVRDAAGQTTGRLDLVAGGSGAGENNPAFVGASADGSIVYFVDSQRLTADASPADPLAGSTFDLYRCQVGPVEGGTLGCVSLADISAPPAGSGEKAEVIGVTPGQSEDAARVYFFARGVLDTAPNEAGDTAVAGEPNLYLWEEGEGRRFIATVSEQDRADWGGGEKTATDGEGSEAHLSASASPSGRYLAFMSERSLTGYDSRDAKSDEPLEEVFRYDASEDHLDCVSCNPSGASPEGKLANPTGSEVIRADTQSNWSQRWVAAVLPAAQASENEGIALYRPRVVHDNGRVFFNAIDPLVSADANGEWDVYQYEPTGVGDCTPSSEGAAIARSAGGCISLLSSGTAEEEAAFVDSSETGDDVFFITPARLSVTDEDSELDVYDTRVKGVPATLPVINECLGEACQAAPNPPNDPTPNSASFRGAGNVPSERCAQNKRKVAREGSSRCVAKKHKHKKHSKKKAKRAASKRRAHR